ncbi:MAG: hypothetical protein ACLSV6_10660 [Butyricicoccus sp.]
MKNRQRKSACTAATVASANAKTSCIYNYTTTAIDRQVPDLEVLDGGCAGVRPRMVGIGFTLLLLTAVLTDNGTLPLWGTVLTGVVGAVMMLGGVKNG